MIRPPPRLTLFPNPALSRSGAGGRSGAGRVRPRGRRDPGRRRALGSGRRRRRTVNIDVTALKAVEREKGIPADTVIEAIESRSEEHTSELQSRQYLVCRLLL